MELSAFLTERVKGALVRSHFFNLERSVTRRKQMVCLQLLEGRITTVQEEMRAHIRSFYGSLFGAERCCSLQIREELLEHLPQLSPDE